MIDSYETDRPIARLWPLPVSRRPSILDPARQANSLLRRFKRIEGMEIPEPKVLDNDAIWAYWFGEDGRLKSNVAEDRDNFIVIKGPTGCGKSTLELRAARTMYPADIQVATLKDHLAFSVQQFHELILKSRDTFVGLDEAAVGGGATDWNSPEARALMETAQTMRWRHITTALLIPNAEDLLAGLRIRRAEFHIRCQHHPKGEAVIREKNWDLDRPLKRGDLGLRTRWPLNPIQWDPFAGDDPLWIEYLRLKQEADDARARRQLVLLQARETYTTGQAAQALGVTSETIRRWVKSGMLPGEALPSGTVRIPSDSLRRLVYNVRAKTPQGPVRQQSDEGHPSVRRRRRIA